MTLFTLELFSVAPFLKTIPRVSFLWFIKSEEDDEGPGLAALLGGDLDSDEDDDNYDSNEEPEGSDGDNDIEEDDDEQEDGAGPSSKPGSSG